MLCRISYPQGLMFPMSNITTFSKTYSLMFYSQENLLICYYWFGQITDGLLVEGKGVSVVGYVRAM